MRRAVSGERSVGLIGCGLIGRPVIRALARGEIDGWKLGAVLGQSDRQVEGVDVSADADGFFSQPFDLIVEAAGPSAVRQHVERALSVADVWCVSGTALADEPFRRRLETVGAQAGHRLRLVPGAIGGLDAVSTLAVAHDAQVHTVIDLVPTGDVTSVVFTGSVAEAAEAFPNHVNVAVATALAGIGPERTAISVRQPKLGDPHTLVIEASSRDGSVSATTLPVVSPPNGLHIVSSSLIASLRTESAVIWVG